MEISESRKSTLAQRFMVKVHQEENGCWRWLGVFDGTPRNGPNPRGMYGRFRIDQIRMIGAHRASYLIFRGPIPNGLHVLHRCDNPACVNPIHLWLGTNQDNVTDCRSKGRAVDQQPGWIPGRKGKGKYTYHKIGNRRCIEKECAICNKKCYQDSGNHFKGGSPVCSKSCQNILTAWCIYLRHK